MKYAKIKNNRISHVINGLAPPDYVEVIVKWVYPTEYPLGFYVNNSNEPIATIEGNEVHENWAFILMDIEGIKNYIYDEQQKIRCKMQLGSFEFDGDTIVLEDRSDIDKIKLLSDNSNGYKFGRNKWKRGQGKIIQLKLAAAVHDDAAWDWEMANNDLVDVMTTEDELKIYFEAM